MSKNAGPHGGHDPGGGRSPTTSRPPPPPGPSGLSASTTRPGSCCFAPTRTRSPPSTAGPVLYAVEEAGHQVNFEEVTLVVGGQAASHLDSLVEAFTLSDLPVPVWYVGDIPDPADPCSRWPPPCSSTPATPWIRGRTARVLELARRRTVVDLSWIRLAPWRELLAGLFEPVSRRPWLRAVRAGGGLGQGRSPPSARRLAGRPAPSPAPTRCT